MTGKQNFVLQVLMAIFFPLQGFFNCLVYLRPRYLRSKSRNPNASARRIIYLSLHHESHPIHRLQNTNGGTVPWEREEDRMYTRSTTASYYSAGNSRLRSVEELDSNDDASFSITSVNAIASVSDYNRGCDEIAPDAKNVEVESNVNMNDDIGRDEIVLNAKNVKKVPNAYINDDREPPGSAVVESLPVPNSYDREPPDSSMLPAK